eukprot:TRINITY_DN18415_c0_g1_i1.p1 TRINITY_DN18415_c0_g1~~TRINITY_DN18415_c0_g1_i1.p1  ORF type:complete len:625 (+),score=186.07 TRINITY_DN18415_c0_g1_i1:450-2324(+)
MRRGVLRCLRASLGRHAAAQPARRWKRGDAGVLTQGGPQDRAEAGFESMEDAMNWGQTVVAEAEGAAEIEKPKVGKKGVVEEVPDHFLRVALFGPPNVGKTRLFNCITETEDHNIRWNIAGLTSDCKSAEGQLGRMYFTVIDTPGIVDGFHLPQLDLLVDSIDVALFVVDVKAPMTPDVLHMYKWLEAQNVPTILLANKDDQGQGMTPPLREAFLQIPAFGAPVFVSAHEKTGFGQLQDLLAPYHAVREASRKYDEWALEDRVIAGEIDARDELAERRRMDRPIRIALAGVHNVGKSTLLNSLLGYERNHVTPVQGTTRDVVSVTARYRGHRVNIVDTAGLAPKVKDRWMKDPKQNARAMRDVMTHWMHMHTVNACRSASVVLFVFDAREGLPLRDKKLVKSMLDAGRPVILVANKWDEVANKSEMASDIEDSLKTDPDTRFCTVVCVSAKNGTNLTLLMETVLDHYRRWHMKVSTGKINLFWHKIQATLHIPVARSKVRHFVQLATGPPTFCAFLSRGMILQGNYARFMLNKIRKEFRLDGIPIRLVQRRKPPSVFKQLGYTNPTKVYKSPGTQMRVKWKAWENAEVDVDPRTAGEGNAQRMSARAMGTSVPRYEQRRTARTN